MTASFEFDWKFCERCGHEVMWAKVPGAPERAAHVCEAPRIWVVQPAECAVEDDE